MSASAARGYDDARSANLGWIAAALVILGVFVVGAAFWFRYHP